MKKKEEVIKKKVVVIEEEVVVETAPLTDEEVRMKVMVDKAAELQALAQEGNRFGK